MNKVNEYIEQKDEVQKEWLLALITFMRDQFPQLEETFSFQMPMFKFNGKYIAFSVAKEHFTFHTLDFEMIEELKTLLPKAKFGKGCAKIKYQDTEAIPVLFNMSIKIVERNTVKKD
ncbi:MAG: hypothetical protein K0S47_3521 [Herbinix sp.]|jgi:uncharacterized protein YdhG (YjbR/CyaY superfamily)|nr:hypothetical protein [Herbinix sp.]